MSTFDYDILLLDIEGTTTPISFVHDILFPYARANMDAFLKAQWSEEAVQKDLQAIQEQHQLDQVASIDGLPALPASDSEDFQKAILTYLLWQMDHDRKTTGLKSLQGKIWYQGYHNGSLKGEIFEDIPEVFKHHKDNGLPIYIYSSGSIHAQKLLFGQTTAGDLLPYLKGHFDTTTGPKKEAESYTLIAKEIGAEPARILFATDILGEALAAEKAGIQAILMDRPGNHPQPEHHFPVFTQLQQLMSSGN